MQEQVEGFDWWQIILLLVAALALILSAVLFLQIEEVMHGRSAVAFSIFLVAGSGLLAAPPDAMEINLPPFFGWVLFTITVGMLILTLFTRRWLR